MSFGSNLRLMREQRNISQKMLSIKIGVTQSSISDWEADRKMPPSKTILKLADIFNVSTDEIFERPASKASSCLSPISQLYTASRNQPCYKKANDTRCNFSLRVKGLRERDGYTQSNLAKVLHVSQSTIGGWETQVREPTLKGISDLCSIFNTSADYLLGLTSNPNIPISASSSDSSLVSQLCTVYNLNDKARAMIEMIIAMPPNECEIIAELAQRYTSLLNRKVPEDENEPFRRAADQLTNDKKNDGITKARA